MPRVTAKSPNTESSADWIGSMMHEMEARQHCRCGGTETHAHCCRCKGKLPEGEDCCEACNLVIRSRTEALNRLRGKGAQTVVVKHVHVHEGGQAIVGTVTQNKLVEGEREAQALE